MGIYVKEHEISLTIGIEWEAAYKIPSLKLIFYLIEANIPYKLEFLTTPFVYKYSF